MVRRCLNGSKKETNTFKLLGYDTIKLKQRIEIQFKNGMSWDNYGKWHIDHKKPISKFKEGTNINIINALSNLQPLWAKENLSKGNKF
jgi:outer membrane receptor for monomeric catechols